MCYIQAVENKFIGNLNEVCHVSSLGESLRLSSGHLPGTHPDPPVPLCIHSTAYPTGSTCFLVIVPTGTDHVLVMSLLPELSTVPGVQEFLIYLVFWGKYFQDG
jgi:hypothetical protein